MNLTLDAVSGDTFNDIFLEQDEHDDDRQQRQHRHSEQTAVVVVAIGVGVELQCQRDGIILRAGNEDQRLEEVLPDPCLLYTSQQDHIGNADALKK